MHGHLSAQLSILLMLSCKTQMDVEFWVPNHLYRQAAAKSAWKGVWKCIYMHPTVLGCSEWSSMVVHSSPSLNVCQEDICLPTAHHMFFFGSEPEQKNGKRLTRCYGTSPGRRIPFPSWQESCPLLQHMVSSCRLGCCVAPSSITGAIPLSYSKKHLNSKVLIMCCFSQLLDM